MPPLHLALRYIVFAMAATAANLGTQAVVFAAYPDHGSLYAALVLGTGFGLVVKYILDKRWIFFDAEHRPSHQARQFTLYTIMGLATTGIFWGTELAFDRLFANHAMHLAGGAIGLALGYTLKYRLDSRYVFNRREGIS